MHIFGDYHQELREKIGSERQELIAFFENRYTNLDNFSSFTHKIEKKMQEVTAQVAALKRVIGAGKDKIMRVYLGRKECKKGKLLGELEASVAHTRSFARTMQQCLRYKQRVQLLGERGRETEKHVAATIASLQELEEKNIRTMKPANSNIKELEQQLHQRIQQSYTLIQEGIVAANSMLAAFK